MLSKIKEEARDLYDTYTARMDSLLLVNTLLLGLCFSSLQCPGCLAVQV